MRERERERERTIVYHCMSITSANSWTDTDRMHPCINNGLINQLYGRMRFGKKSMNGIDLILCSFSEITNNKVNGKVILDTCTHARTHARPKWYYLDGIVHLTIDRIDYLVHGQIFEIERWAANGNCRRWSLLTIIWLRVIQLISVNLIRSIVSKRKVCRCVRLSY